mmetsp:Transcript_4123/g.6738  ORF Transcript_4123/g.6738 Transcript_4123/m.6738 type:complete len:158 (-) Transcript_4123:46-519(-)
MQPRQGTALMNSPLMASEDPSEDPSVASSFTEATSNQSQSEHGRYSEGPSELSTGRPLKRYRKLVRKLQAAGVFAKLRNELANEKLAKVAMERHRLPPALQTVVLGWYREPSLTPADREWIERWQRCRDIIHRHAAGQTQLPVLNSGESIRDFVWQR